MSWPPRVWRTPEQAEPRRVNTTFGELDTDETGAPTRPASDSDETIEERTDGAEHDGA